MNSAEPLEVTVEYSRHLQRWLGIQDGTKPKVYLQVFAAARINSLSYWLEIFFSAGIATFGLVESSPAVIIGAMLISPLMGPIMGTGLALAVGDLYLGLKAVTNLVVSVAVSIAFSGFLVWILPFHSATTEILARTNPNLLDLGIALLSGLAGSVVVSRGSGDGVTALPGVAIAVALMPPLCTVGFGLGSGLNGEIMGGAALLFLTNLVAIVASAFLVFLLVGLNSSAVQKAVQASRDESLAQALSHGPIKRILETGGQLRWRVLMILVLLAAVAVPLRRALLQVTSDTLIRGAVQDELKSLAPASVLVSQQVSFEKDAIVIRLISTKPIKDDKIAAVRQELMRRTGQEVQISVEAVASRRELADLMARLARPAVVAAPELSVSDAGKELVQKVKPALESIWPTADAPIQSFEVATTGTGGIVVSVAYQATADLGTIPLKMVQQSLQTKLVAPDLELKTNRIAQTKAKQDRQEKRPIKQ